MSEKDIEQFLDEMADFIEMFEPAFQRVEQFERSKVYLRGLLGDAVRKNVELQIHLEKETPTCYTETRTPLIYFLKLWPVKTHWALVRLFVSQQDTPLKEMASATALMESLQGMIS